MRLPLNHLRRLWIVVVSLSRSLLPHSRLSNYQRFLVDGGNSLLIDDFNLHGQSQVVDFGGYLGDWSFQIHQTYGSQVCIVEPVPQFVDHLTKRFESNVNVRIFPYVCSSQIGLTNLFLSNDGTGFFADGKSIDVESRSVSDLLDFIGRDVIDLVMINIEGGEYELLGLLQEHGVIAKTKHILVQFHQIAGASPTEHQAIQSMLAISHKLVFDYPFIWQRWDLRSEAKSRSSLR